MALEVYKGDILGLDNLLVSLADQFAAEFPGSALDAEWTETAYSDLSSHDRGLVSWREFHDALAPMLRWRSDCC